MAHENQQPLVLDSSDLEKLPVAAFPSADKGNTTWRTIFSAPGTSTDSLSAGIAQCPPGGLLAPHRHRQAELYYVLAGTGTVEIEGKRYRAAEGTAIWIPGDAEHGVSCGPGDEGLRWLYVFPEGRFDSVVYRFSGQGGP